MPRDRHHDLLLSAGEADDTTGASADPPPSNLGEVSAQRIAPDVLDALLAFAESQGLTASQAVAKLVANGEGFRSPRTPSDVKDGRAARLSVNINSDTNAALKEVARERNVTMTEAVRRLIGYGFLVYRTIRSGDDVLLRRDGKLERLMLLD